MKLLACMMGAAFAAAAMACRASTFEAMDFDRLVASAEEIFMGTAVASSSSLTGPRNIVTDFEFSDLEVIKGAAAGASTSVRVLGGSVGDATLLVHGAPSFRPGRRYLVFISGNGRVVVPTLGGTQGVFQVRTDPASEKQLMYDYGGRPVVTLPTGHATDEMIPFEKRLSGPAMGAEAFIAEIRRRLGERQ